MRINGERTGHKDDMKRLDVMHAAETSHHTMIEAVRRKASYTRGLRPSRWVTIAKRLQCSAHSALHFHWVTARRSGPIEGV